MQIWRDVSLALAVASAILALVLVWRLGREGLRTYYPWLVTFLVFDAIRTFATVLYPPATTAAGYLYIATEPVAWTLSLLMVREVFHIVLRDHPGIDSVSRRFIRYAAVAAAASSLALLWMDYEEAGGRAGLMQATFLFGRVILVALVALLAAGVVFMSWFPVRITRNAATLLTGYAVYLGSKAVVLLIRNITGSGFNTSGGIALLVTFIACLIAGSVRLTASGETRNGRLRPLSDPAETERLLAQLERVNRKLEETIRR